MKIKSFHFWILSVAVIAFALVFTTGCEKERFLDPELSSHEMPGGIDLQGDLLSIPGQERFLVGFHTEPDIDIVKGVGGEVFKTFTIVPAVAARLSAQAVEALEKNPKVRYVEPDHEVFAHSQTLPWGIDRVFGDETYSFPTWGTSRGGGIGVAIIDSGIDGTHEDLKVVGGVRFRTTGFILRQDDQYKDDNGHGTHVAGTVAALDNGLGVVGVGPGIDLYAIKVLDASGSGSVSTVVAGIEWAVAEGIPVLNMSLGSSSPNQTMKDACDAAYKAGHLLVASAGNSGNTSGTGDNVGYPGAYESVIAVAASTINNTRASFSSTGPAVELIAPGSGILSTLPGNKYGTYSGTSMASPHVAGVAALVLAAGKDLSNEDVRKILQDTAEDLGLSSNHQGHGLARADLAVRAVADVVSPATGSIEGTVKDNTDVAIEGATVIVEGTNLSAITNATGNYLLENVPTGEQEVTASADGYYSEKKTVTVTEDATVTLECTLEAIPPTSTWAVSGTVTGNGSLLEGATVTITETGQSATTEDGGSYSISDVEEGTYNITASADGYSSETKNVTIDNHATVDFSLTEKPEAPLSIEKFEVTNTSNPAWARATVDWVVSGNNLSIVKSEMLLDGRVVDSVTSSVSGSAASGSHELRHRAGSGEYTIRLTVTDQNDNYLTEIKAL